MSAAKRKKTAWYMMFVVGFVLLIIAIFLPINNSSNIENADSIFTKVASFTGFKPKPPPQTKILLAGDIMLGRTVMTKSLDVGNNIYAFEKIKDRLNESHMVFANLENPVIEECPRHYEGFKFCSLPSLLDGLTESNVQVVTLANNHSKNYGETGFEETKKHLDSRNIDYVGDNNLVIKEFNKTKFGFLGFDFLTNTLMDTDLEQIGDADKEVDVLIVGVHWGVEYTPEPRQIQRDWAQKMVESGADVIVGHHPHWVQTSETLEDAPVYYSLGNLIFDQMWSEKTRTGKIIELVFEGKDIVRTNEIDTYMTNWAQPEIVTK